MRRALYITCLCHISFLTFLFTSCKAIKTAVQNTPLIERIKGSWKLESTNDNNALLGSTMTIYPENNDGLISTLQNNHYCVRPNEVIWKDISDSNEGLNINSLVNSCNSSLVYKPAVVTLVAADELQLSGTTASGKQLTQTWKRIPVPVAVPVKKK